MIQTRQQGPWHARWAAHPWQQATGSMDAAYRALCRYFCYANTSRPALTRCWDGITSALRNYWEVLAMSETKKRCVSRHTNQKVNDYFANQLCRAMAKQNLSALQISRMIGCTMPAVSKWLAGQRLPSGSLMDALCKAIGVSPNRMLGWGKIKQPLKANAWTKTRLASRIKMPHRASTLCKAKKVPQRGNTTLARISLSRKGYLSPRYLI